VKSVDVFVEHHPFEVPDLRRAERFGKLVVQTISQRKAPDGKPQSLRLIVFFAQRSTEGMPALALEGPLELREPPLQSLLYRLADIDHTLVDDANFAWLPTKISDHLHTG